MLSIENGLRVGVLAAALLASTVGQASVWFTAPDKSTDFHFTFKDGSCTALRLHHLAPEIWPHDASITGFGCQGGEAYFNFSPGQSGPYTLTLPNVYKADDPFLDQHKGGKVTITRGWWTPSGETFLRDYVVTVPEPAVWSMLITGFGIIGWIRRRHGKMAIC